MGNPTDTLRNTFIPEMAVLAEAQARQKEYLSVLLWKSLCRFFALVENLCSMTPVQWKGPPVQWNPASVQWKASPVQWKDQLRAVERWSSQERSTPCSGKVVFTTPTTT